ncbi:recombinase family protein [Paracoccus lichenicola]|uniref:recombinase family protein n=1 Tax=Paracoccus lichenicola TaxID=2665644 RepID=UPI002E231AF7
MVSQAQRSQKHLEWQTALKRLCRRAVSHLGTPAGDRMPMPRIGYARVSTSSQDLDIQKARLRATGCEIVRSETGSGASRDGRSELATGLSYEGSIDHRQ